MQIRALSKLQIDRSGWPPQPLQKLPPPTPVEVLGLVEANASSLDTILIHGDALWSAPLVSLRRFTLLDAVHLSALPGILDITGITELKLSVMDRGIRQMIDALSAAPDACPRLTALKLVCDDGETVKTQAVSCDMLPVAIFVKNKRSLRRLHVVFYSVVRVDERPLLEAISDLPELHVVGMDIARDSFTKADLEFLDAKLPMNLTNLLLYSEFEQSEPSGMEIATVVSYSDATSVTRLRL